MNVSIYREGEKIGSLPYTSLPAFRLLCEQTGYRTDWKPGQTTFHLIKELQGREILILHKQPNQEARTLMEKIRLFLMDWGADVKILEDPVPRKGKELMIECTVDVPDSVDSPFLIDSGPGAKSRRLAKAVRRELKENGIPSRIREQSLSHRSPDLHLHGFFPSSDDEGKHRDQLEKTAFSLVTAILRFFRNKRPLASLSCLPFDPFSSLIPGFEGVPVKTGDDDQDKKTPQSGVTNSKETEPVEAVQPSSTEPARVDTHPAKKELLAEVFFDYTLISTGEAERPFVVLGNLYIKNTGTETLHNPMICLHPTPRDSVRLGGQILPPNLVETLGVQGSEGPKGWRYLEEDWFRKARERGEYWICPIHALGIAPGTSETFERFQLSVSKQEQGQTVSIEGVVYFQQQDLKLPSNNRISISF
ncbi:hypothetical protein C8P63_10994 [Melghirimyces profundicolus]|uniref:Uncharacterized protein n=1 Tax=Melghirimyces profundicolus TaxID=1242148 RepID=A0A2T6BWA0_9BACL|nr:hypothetical protein [Melghirimyces profundicolus]PTX60329.1 hypothetical protein C8P63_10994 [Melghirimyces profundicolus]